MKLVVVFLMVLGTLLGAPRPVRAELPPYNPEMMKPDPDVPKAQKFTPVYRGPMTFYTTEYGDTQSVLLKAGTTFGFQLQDVIMPWKNEDDKNIASPVLDPMATFYENIQPMQVPQEVISKSIHWSPINENIQDNVFCARIINRSQFSDDQEDISSTGHQLSANIPRSQELYEGARKMNALWGRHTFESITPGYYDWNLPTEQNSINDASPYCMQGRESTPFSELENPVTQLATFGGGSIDVTGYVWQTISHFVENAAGDLVEVIDNMFPMYRTNLTEVSVDGNAQQVCNIGDCNAEEVDGTKYEFVKELDDTRGLTFNFLPEEIAAERAVTEPAKRAAQQVYQYSIFGITTQSLAGVELYGENMKKDNLHATNALLNARDRSEEMVCTGVPQEILDTYTVYLAAPKVIPLTKEQKEKMSPAQLAAAEMAAKEKANKAAIPINQTCKPPEEEEEEELAGWNCDTSVPEQLSEEVNNKGQGWADNAIYTDACKTDNAWKLCHNDVVASAKKACVDPLFALTIWLHESAASNYKCGEPLARQAGCTAEKCVQDFGVNKEDIAENFSAQLDEFLKLDYGCPHTIQDFVSMYYIGNNCYNDEPDKDKINTYVAELQEIYTELGGGTLPSWPKGQCSN